MLRKTKDYSFNIQLIATNLRIPQGGSFPVIVFGNFTCNTWWWFYLKRKLAVLPVTQCGSFT